MYFAASLIVKVYVIGKAFITFNEINKNHITFNVRIIVRNNSLAYKEIGGMLKRAKKKVVEYPGWRAFACSCQTHVTQCSNQESRTKFLQPTNNINVTYDLQFIRILQ